MDQFALPRLLHEAGIATEEQAAKLLELMHVAHEEFWSTQYPPPPKAGVRRPIGKDGPGT
jgi:hypothetical protein